MSGTCATRSRISRIQPSASASGQPSGRWSTSSKSSVVAARIASQSRGVVAAHAIPVVREPERVRRALSLGVPLVDLVDGVDLAVGVVAEVDLADEPGGLVDEHRDDHRDLVPTLVRHEHAVRRGPLAAHGERLDAVRVELGQPLEGIHVGVDTLRRRCRHRAAAIDPLDVGTNESPVLVEATGHGQMEPDPSDVTGRGILQLEQPLVRRRGGAQLVEAGDRRVPLVLGEQLGVKRAAGVVHDPDRVTQPLGLGAIGGDPAGPQACDERSVADVHLLDDGRALDVVVGAASSRRTHQCRARRRMSAGDPRSRNRER